MGRRAGAALLLALATAAPARAQDPDADKATLLTPARRPLLEQTMLAELSRAREDRGLPPLAWDERLALGLREHVAAMLAAGWSGGPPIATPAGNATARAKSRHRLAWPEVFDNYSPQRADAWSPTVVAEALIGGELMKSFREPTNTVGAAVVVEGKDGVYSCLAVAAGDAAAVDRAADQTAAAWLAVLGTSGPDRVDALARHLPPGEATALPWLIDLVRTERDPALRAAVVTALGGLDSTAAIAPLVALLSSAKGDAAAPAVAALAMLTGESHADAKAWDNWWRSDGPRFKLPDRDATPATAPPEPVPGPAALAGFRKAAKHADPLLRAIACRGLGAARAERAAATLAKLMADPDPEVRLTAVAALGALGDATALPSLQKAWPGCMASPRAALVALRAAGRLGTPKAARLLEADPFTPDAAGVVVARCGALVALRDRAALGAAIGLLPEVARRHGDGASAAVRAALAAATGAAPGDTPAAWTGWWTANKAAFEFPAPPEAK